MSDDIPAAGASLFAGYGFRPLRLDAGPRYVVLGGKGHGTAPDRHERAIFDRLIIDFVLRGSGRYTEATGRVHPLAPGTLLHRFPGVEHSTWYDPDSDYAEFWIVFDPATSEQVMSLGMIAAEPVVQVGAEGMALAEFRRLHARSRRPESEVSSRTILLEVMAFLDELYERGRRNRELGSWDRVLRDGSRLLERGLEQRLPIESIVSDLGVSYTAFRRRFTRELGISPGDYRIRRRIEAAQRLLMTRSVKQVAIALGYNDPFALTAQFKKVTGVSPSAFQRGLRRPGA